MAGHDPVSISWPATSSVGARHVTSKHRSCPAPAVAFSTTEAARPAPPTNASQAALKFRSGPSCSGGNVARRGSQESKNLRYWSAQMVESQAAGSSQSAAAASSCGGGQHYSMTAADNAAKSSFSVHVSAASCARRAVVGRVGGWAPAGRTSGFGVDDIAQLAASKTPTVRTVAVCIAISSSPWMAKGLAAQCSSVTCTAGSCCWTRARVESVCPVWKGFNACRA